MTWAELYEFAVEHWLTFGFGLVTAGLAAGYRRYSNRVKRERESATAVRLGVEMLLADKILWYHHMCDEQGYCPNEARESAAGMYSVYHAIGGNGNITDIYERILKLPVEKHKE